MKGRRWGIVGLALMVGLLVVALAAIGCGGSSSSSSSTSPSASAASGGPDQAHAQAQLTPLYPVPTFVALGPAFDAKTVMAGKTIESVPGTGTDPFYVQVEIGQKGAATAVGYQHYVWNNQGQLTQYQQGVENGVARKVSLIDLLAGPDPKTLKPQISDAKSAGIPVVSSHLSGIEQQEPNVIANLAVDYRKAGELLADWVIAKDPKAHCLVIVSDELASTAAMRDGVSSEFNTYGGPDIKYTFVNVPIPEWGTKIKPTVQSAIVADAALTYVICIYDNMSHFVTPAVEATNSVGKVKVIGFNATPSVLDLVRQGKVEMDFGDSLNWAGYAIADAEMRIIAGTLTPQNGTTIDLKIPFRLFDKSNVGEAGIPASYTKGFGDFQSGYLKLWGL